MDIRDEIAMAKLAKQQLIPPTTEQATPTKAFEPNLPSPEKLTKSAELNKEPNEDPKESKKLESEVEVTENDDGSMLLKDLKDDKKTPQKLVVKFKKVIQESEKDMKIGPTSEHLLSETPVHIPLKKITKSLESNKNGKNESKSKVQVKGASSVKKGTRRSWRIALNTSFSKYTNDIRNPDKIDSDDDDQASKGKTVKGEVQKKRAPKIVMEERKSDDDFEDPKKEKNVKNKTQKEVQKSNSDDDFQVPNREKKVKEETAKVVKERKKVIPNRKVSKKSLPKKNLKKISETEPVSEFENEAKPYVPYNGDRIPCRQWLVNNYDENNNTLNIGSCKLNVTPLEVSQILGIPMGEELVSEKERPREDVNDEEIEHDEGMDKDVSFLIEKSTFLNVDVTTDFEKRLQETVDISPKATSTAEEIFEFNENQERPKRKIILSDSLRSPYVQRPVVMKAKITKIESDMAEFIFSASLTHSDTVFTTASGEVATRDTFESLCP
ncbi:hypothetical protein SSX86_024593 [Deinandra increscens subsp. villosa]|uniref:Uncharacterized protein n=1 Tax=Deinandra increscens subsp. villosa TaxID=3103831 RepID=A0AAP0GMG0_9ASTR